MLFRAMNLYFVVLQASFDGFTKVSGDNTSSSTYRTRGRTPERSAIREGTDLSSVAEVRTRSFLLRRLRPYRHDLSLEGLLDISNDTECVNDILASRSAIRRCVLLDDDGLLFEFGLDSIDVFASHVPRIHTRAIDEESSTPAPFLVVLDVFLETTGVDAVDLPETSIGIGVDADRRVDGPLEDLLLLIEGRAGGRRGKQQKEQRIHGETCCSRN